MLHKKEKEFLQHIKEIKDYWLNVPSETLLKRDGESEIETRVDGVIFSILVMFDGSSGVNDFQNISLINGHSYDERCINQDPFCELHELWCKMK